MDLFSKQSPNEIATKTAASKLSNGAAIIGNDLSKEPIKGLMHVLGHVQKSVPLLLDTHHGLEATSVQLQAVLEQLQDAQEGIMSVTGPATQQDLVSLAASLQTLDQLAQQQQEQLDLLQKQQRQHTATHAGTSSNSSSAASGSGIAKLWRGS